MWLICPVRPGEQNEELRYALRSWEANLHLAGGLELMVVGDCPQWLHPDYFLAANYFPSIQHAVYDNVMRGAAQAMALGVDEVVFMNDDFFCLDPVGCILPVKRNSSLADHIAQFPDGAGLWWPRSLRLTAYWLAGQGFLHPDSYEVHRPLLASAEAMFKTLSLFDYAPAEVVPQWRTMYGVVNNVQAYPVVDAKLGIRSTGYGTPWVSTSDQSWRRYQATIRPRFQKPSRWEK